MRVHIHERNGTTLRVPIPTGLVLNGLTAPLIHWIANPYLQKHGITLTLPQLRALFRALREAKHCLSSMPLAEISEKDGDQVTVWL